MFDIVCLGSSLVDLFITSKEFSLSKSDQGVLLCSRFGEKIDVDEFTMVSGGGASNTAVGFARQGFSVASISELGKDALSHTVLDELLDEGVDTSMIIREKREDTGMSVILIAPAGGRTILVNRGASSQLEDTDIEWLQLIDSRWLHVSSLAGQFPLLQKIMYHVGEHKQGFSWNPGTADLALLQSGQLQVTHLTASILFLNRSEWQLLESLQLEIKQRIPVIIITSGKEGGVVYTKGVETKYSSLEVPTKDETGAGDAFGVGFVSAHLRGASLQECIELGKANAAGVVQQMGAKAGLLSQTKTSILN